MKDGHFGSNRSHGLISDSFMWQGEANGIFLGAVMQFPAREESILRCQNVTRVISC